MRKVHQTSYAGIFIVSYMRDIAVIFQYTFSQGDFSIHTP